MAKHKVLSTKKLELSLIEQAKEIGIEIIEQEFISVELNVAEEKSKEVYEYFEKPYAVFTSANAVAAVERYLRQNDSYYIINWKIFCLSGKTKDAINNALLLPKQIIGEAENATGLAKEIIEHGVKEVVFFCGDKRRDELPDILKDAGITVYEVIVYETVETPGVAADDFDAVLFFSPSAVQSFFSVNALKKDAVCFAIGKTTAESIADFAGNKVIISQSPSQEVMLAAVNSYFENAVAKNAE